MNKIIFGPAGSPNRFKEAKFKSTLDLPQWLKDQGLDTLEYACGRGIVMGEEFAGKFAVATKEADIKLSMHAPYFINLATEEPEKQEKTWKYLADSVKFSKMMGADRIVFHPGSAAKDRMAALERALKLFARFLEWMEEVDPENKIRLGIETHGKANQMGNISELIALCKLNPKRVIPVIDWSHLYAVQNGGFDEAGEYQAILELLAKELGDHILENLHMHFSAIEYGPSGEVRHWTFADNFGPNREPLIEALIKVNGTGRIICECSGTQDVDALMLQNIYKTMLK